MRELTAEELIEFKKKLVVIYRDLQDICKANNLRCFAAGGTAIGAVRHQGFIPWDDDIDVMMPRPDYDRLIELSKEEKIGNYELITPHNSDNYPLSFIKFCDKNSTLVENPHIPCIFGIYIDVFPLDGTSDDRDEAIRLQQRYLKLCNRLEAISNHNTFSEYIALLTTPHEWGRFIVKTAGFFCRKTLRKHILRRLDKISSHYPYNASRHIISYAGNTYKSKEFMETAVHEGEPIIMPFEDIEATMSPGYDTYLKNLFGDYMKLPPKEKQVSHHLFCVIDTSRRLTEGEVSSLLQTVSQ